MNRKTLIKKVILAILFFGVAYFPLFHYLDFHSFRMWDEAIYAVNAYEMAGNNDFVSRHFDGSPMLWNPKPPLVTWIQTIAFKLFGFSELIFRLPIAFFSLFTVVWLISFCHARLNMKMLGIFAALTLITTSGYIHFHVARTGDPDGPLAFFVLGYCLVFYRFLEAELAMRRKLFFLFIFLLTCAVMTKSIAGLIAIPALFIWAAYQKKLLWILKQAYVYLGIVVSVGLVVIYYTIHEIQTPGFLENVFARESGRFLNVREHSQPFFFYIRVMYEEKFMPWLLVLPLSFLLLTVEKNAKLKSFISYIALISVLYVLILSTAETKLVWYLAPVYPFLCLMVGFVMLKVYDAFIFSMIIRSDMIRQIAGITLILTTFTYSYVNIVLKVTSRKDHAGELYGYYLKKLETEKPAFTKFTIIESSLNPHLTYYKNYYNQQKGYKISQISPPEVSEGDTVICCDSRVIESIKRKYHIKKLGQYLHCYRLITIKKLDPE